MVAVEEVFPFARLGVMLLSGVSKLSWRSRREVRAMPDFFFRGPGPIPLPTLQVATASALEDSVEMQMHVLIDGETETLVIQMLARVAVELADDLNRAAARVKSRKT